MKIAIERRIGPRRAAHANRIVCRKQRRGVRAPCHRFVQVAVLTFRKGAGRRSTRFSGRVHGKPLRPGRYRARIVAIGAAEERSRSHQARFRILPW